MPRGKRIVIEKTIKDPVVSKLKSMKISDLRNKRIGVEKDLHANVSEIVDKARELVAAGKECIKVIIEPQR